MSDNLNYKPDTLYNSVISRAHANILAEDPPDYAIALCATGELQDKLIKGYAINGFRGDNDEDIEMYYPALHLNQSPKLKPMLDATVWNEEKDGQVKRRDLPEGSWKMLVKRYVGPGISSEKISRDRDWHDYCEEQYFKYDTGHESKFGLLKLQHLPIYMKFILKTGMPNDDLRWELSRQVFEEFNPSLSVNKLCALLLMIFGLQHLKHYYKDLSKCRPWCANTNDEYIKRAKAFTVAVRKYSINSDGVPLPKEAIVEAAYMEMASGRSENRFSLPDELKHRTAYTVPMMYPDANGNWTKEEFTRQLYEVCAEQLRAVEYKPKFPSSRRLFMERAAWASSGASDKRMPWLDEDGRTKQVKVNKRVSCQNTTWNDVMEHIAKPPRIVFTIADKFECAKGRAILSSDDMHSFISHLVMVDQEVAVQGCEWAGHATRSGEGCRMLYDFQRGLRAGNVFLGTDWDDFNIHQSDYHQHAMARAVVERQLQSREWDDYALEESICTWWANSFLNQNLDLYHEIIRLLQGLGSGVRVTDYFNTLFNRCVWVLAEKLSMRVQSNYCRAVLTKHIGDDTGALFRTRWEAALTYYATLAIGAKMNLFKQLFSEEWCEMLRRVVTSTGIYAFQNRAMGNLQSPPTQRSEAVTIYSQVTSRLQAISELISRGYSKAGAIALTEWVYYCAHMMPKVTRIHPHIIDLDLDMGGMGCYRGPYRLASNSRILTKQPKVPGYREHIWHSFLRTTSAAHATTDLLELIRHCTTANGVMLSEDENVDLARLCDDKTKNDYQAAEPPLTRKKRLMQQDRLNGQAWYEAYQAWSKSKMVPCPTNAFKFRFARLREEMPPCQDLREIFDTKLVIMYPEEYVLEAFHTKETVVHGITNKRVQQEFIHMVDNYLEHYQAHTEFAVNASAEIGRMILRQPLTSVSDNPFMRFYRKVTSWGNLVNTYTVARACKSDRMFAVKLITYMRDEDWNLLTGSAWSVDLLLKILEEVEDDSTIPAIFMPILGPSFCRTATHLIFCDLVQSGLNVNASTFEVKAEAWKRGWALALALKTMPVLTMMCLP